jgi:Flp pilus assembly pilin Flp
MRTAGDIEAVPNNCGRGRSTSVERPRRAKPSGRIFMGEQRGGLVEERGQTFAEYALILAVISVALIAALTFLSDRLSLLFSYVGNSF